MAAQVSDHVSDGLDFDAQFLQIFCREVADVRSDESLGFQFREGAGAVGEEVCEIATPPRPWPSAMLEATETLERRI